MPKNSDEFSDLALEVELPAGNPYQGVYQLRFGDCTGLDDLACQRETGMTVLQLMAAREQNPTMTAVVASFVAWKSIRKDRPHVTFEMVAASMPWGQGWDLRDPSAEGKEQPDSEPSPRKKVSSRTSPTPASLPGE